jgi:hypothetical protein
MCTNSHRGFAAPKLDGAGLKGKVRLPYPVPFIFYLFLPLDAVKSLILDL